MTPSTGRMRWVIASAVGLVVVAGLVFLFPQNRHGAGERADATRADAARDRATAAQRADAAHPPSPAVQFRLGMLELVAKRPKPALAIFKGIGDAPPRLAGVAMAAHDMRDPTQSQLALHALQTNHGDEAAYRIAQVHAWRRQPDEAFHWLDRALVQRDGGLSDVKYDPALRTLRTDPRYAAFLARLDRQR